MRSVNTIAVDTGTAEDVDALRLVQIAASQGRGGRSSMGGMLSLKDIHLTPQAGASPGTPNQHTPAWVVYMLPAC